MLYESVISDSILLKQVLRRKAGLTNMLQAHRSSYIFYLKCLVICCALTARQQALNSFSAQEVASK